MTYMSPLEFVAVRLWVPELSIAAVAILTKDCDEDVCICPRSEHITRIDHNAVLPLYDKFQKYLIL